MSNSNSNPVDPLPNFLLDEKNATEKEFGVLETKKFPIDYRLSKRRDSNSLVVLLNGAVDRKRMNGPVFQRSSWVEEINANVLNLADPTISEANSLSIGWGQLGEGSGIESLHEATRQICSRLDIADSSLILYGSSAGGFQALQLGARIKGCRVVVNNPQTDWTYYMPTSVRSVLREVYQGISIDEVRSLFPINCSAAQAMISYENIPLIKYFVNTASKSDLTVHLEKFLDEIRSAEHLDRSGINISYYSSPKSGHNPLSKNRTLEIINHEIESLINE